MKAPILNGIFKYLSKEKISFTIPSHKGRVKINTPTLSKFDVKVSNLKDDTTSPFKIVENGESIMSGIFGSDKSYYFTTGKTGAYMALFSTVCKPGDKVIVDSMCDKSVIDAITLLALIPIFIKRSLKNDQFISSPIDEEELIYLTERHHDAKVMVIASPTYFGVCSDIKMVSDISKDAKMLTVVDESWGAHFTFSNLFTKSALMCGADVVIHDLSKTLGAFSHSGMIHINTNKVYIKDFEEKFNMYSKDTLNLSMVCIMENAIMYAFKKSKKYAHILKEVKRARYLITKYTDISWAYDDSKEDNDISLFDDTKIVLNLSKIDVSPFEMSKILNEKFSITSDYYDDNMIVFQISIYNTPSEVRRLADAILSISKTANTKIRLEKEEISKPKRRKVQILPYNAYSREGERIDFEISEGRLSQKCVYKSANSLLILAPGEKITKEHIDQIKMLTDCNQDIYGIDNGKIEVLSLGDSF